MNPHLTFTKINFAPLFFVVCIYRVGSLFPLTKNINPFTDLLLINRFLQHSILLCLFHDPCFLSFGWCMADSQCFSS